MTIGILFALKGGYFRDYADLFAGVPDRTRLLRLLKAHQGWCDQVLADFGFRSAEGIPDNCKLCVKGTWNERMCVETALSMVTMVCDLKRIHHRLRPYIQARLALVVAMFNILLTLFHRMHPGADPFKMSIAEFSL